MTKRVIAKGIATMLCITCCIVQAFAQVKLPTPEKLNFEASNILLLSDGENELGLLVKEYVVVDKKGETMVLLYLPQNNRTIDFSVGYKIDEAKKILFNATSNTSSVEEVGGWQGNLFLSDKGELSYQPINNAQEALLKPYLLEDKRGDETERYALAKVGTQIWMRENLRSDRFVDGSMITTNLSKDQWEKTQSPAMTYYDGNKANRDKMGALYNWYAVKSEISIAPKNWTVPSMEAWETLAKYIDPQGAMTFDYETASLSYTAGEMLKSKTEWIKPPSATGTLLPGNNATMLDMKPYGSTSTSKYFNGYSGLNRQAYFGTSTISDYSDTKALFIRLYWDSHSINSYMDDKFMGFSVRCIAQSAMTLAPWKEVQKEELTLAVPQAGSLASLVKTNQFSTVKSLTLSGVLDARDFKTVQRFTNLQTLVLSNISITSYSGTGGTLEGDQEYKEAEIPENSFEQMSSLSSFSASGAIVSLGAHTFKGCTALAKVMLPKSVKSFRGGNFLNCSALGGITLPSQLEELGASTFKGCISLGEITIPTTITKIKDEVFSDCQALTHIVFSSNIDAIGTSAFSKCTSLSEVVLPNLITTIGDFSFAHCTKLKKIVLSDAMVKIGNSAFLNNALLTELALPNGLKQLGDFALEGCTSISTLKLPISLEHIGDGAFKGTAILFELPEGSQYKLHEHILMDAKGKTVYNLPVNHSKAVTVPEGVETIAGAAFSGCKSLTHIDLPSTIREIKSVALENTALYNIVLRADNPANIKLGENVFGSMDYGRCDLFVPEASLALYRASSPWNLFKLSKITSNTILDNTPLQVSIRKGNIGISLPSEYVGSVLCLYSANGALLYTHRIQSNEINISTGNLVAGVYFLQVGQVVQKIQIL